MNQKLNTGEDLTVKNASAKNRAELEIVDLKGALTLAEDEVKRVTNELATYKKDFAAEQAKYQNMCTQNERMRSLLENLEQTKDELLNRLTSQTQDKRSGDSEKALLVNDIENYQRDLLAKDQLISDLKQSVA